MKQRLRGGWTLAEDLKEIAKIELPYRRRVTVKEARFDSGMTMTRLIFKEGTRITQVDLDAETAEALGTVLLDAARQGQDN